MITEKDVESFHTKGYLVVPNVLSLASILEARAELSYLFQDFPEESKGANITYYSENADACQIRIDHPQLLSQAVRRLIVNHKLGELVTRITGAKAVQAWYCHSLIKPPRVPSSVGWHHESTRPS
jgi:hypothetical protein